MCVLQLPQALSSRAWWLSSCGSRIVNPALVGPHLLARDGQPTSPHTLAHASLFQRVALRRSMAGPITTASRWLDCLDLPARRRRQQPYHSSTPAPPSMANPTSAPALPHLSFSAPAQSDRRPTATAATTAAVESWPYLTNHRGLGPYRPPPLLAARHPGPAHDAHGHGQRQLAAHFVG